MVILTLGAMEMEGWGDRDRDITRDKDKDNTSILSTCQYHIIPNHIPLPTSIHPTIFHPHTCSTPNKICTAMVIILISIFMRLPHTVSSHPTLLRWGVCMRGVLAVVAWAPIVLLVVVLLVVVLTVVVLLVVVLIVVVLTVLWVTWSCATVGVVLC